VLHKLLPYKRLQSFTRDIYCSCEILGTFQHLANKKEDDQAPEYQDYNQKDSKEERAIPTSSNLNLLELLP